LNSGSVRLSNVRGELLGAQVSGEWSADFASTPPKYGGNGRLQGVALSEVAELMHDPWIDGTASVDYQIRGAGWKLQDAIASAEGAARFTVTRGVFSHVVLPGASSPLHTESFAGDLRLEERQFSFGDAKLSVDGKVYKVSGTASLDGGLELKILGGTGYNITGTLFKTRVTAIPVAQAALKP
jgi:uncharacterized protein involved in outer membrane biogenesis